MREQILHDLSTSIAKTTNAKYETEKRRANVSLTALQDYIHYMREKGVTVYPI
jgi:hypothetical protein